MTETMDHDTCSALLRAYVAGEAGDAAPSIAAHLESCHQCRAERAGLKLLLTPIEGLTPAERTLMRDTVNRAIHPPSEQLHSVPVATGSPARRREPTRPASSRPSRTSSWGRLAPALSAAAAVLLIVSGVVLFQHLGVSSGGLAAQSGANGGAAQPGQKAPGTHRSLTTGIPSVRSSLPLPRFAPTPVPSTARAEARAASLLPRFAAAYTGTQASRLAPGFLGRLSRSAPAALGSQVRECGNRVLEEPGRDALPAFGATTEVGGRPILVLVFAASSSSGGRLNRLELRGWPVGSCATELVHRAAAIAG